MNPPTPDAAKGDRHRVLMIDDDRDFCALIADYLGSYDYTIRAAFTGPAGLELALAEPWEAIILDVMLPGMDGFEVLRNIRKTSNVPVLMLTARGEEADQIVGLEIGADDYLAKGASTRQLLARLHAITRRVAVASAIQPVAGPVHEIVIAEMHINLDARKVKMNGQTVALTAGEFDILVALAKAKGRVKTRDHLLEEIRDREYEVFDRAIDVQVSALRRKLGDDPKEPRFIRTIRSAGYMLVDPNTATRF